MALETLDFQRQNRKFAGLIFDHMSVGDRLEWHCNAERLA
jgi:hypothetical protein